jgi:putative membrane protein
MPEERDEAGLLKEFEPDYRFTLANERTFLAWQRTALGLLAAAVAFVQLAPDLTGPPVRHLLGGLLATLAVASSAAGVRRWSQVELAMRRGLPLPPHRMPVWLGAGLALLSALVVALIAGHAVMR